NTFGTSKNVPLEMCFTYRGSFDIKSVSFGTLKSVPLTEVFYFTRFIVLQLYLSVRLYMFIVKYARPIHVIKSWADFSLSRDCERISNAFRWASPTWPNNNVFALIAILQYIEKYRIQQNH
ncbi:unnamed protein product, partial [Owenia fusiformis]